MGNRCEIARSADGSISLMVALGIPILLLTIGVSIDLVRFMDLQESSQSRLDAAALTAARVFIDHESQTQAVQAELAVARATQSLKASGEKPGRDLQITVDAARRFVEITDQLRVETSFLSIANFKSLNVSIKSSAIAELENQPVCILALKSDDGTGIEFTGKGEMKAKDCVVWSNSTGSQSIAFDGNGKVSASRICAVGRSSSASRFSVRPNPESDCRHVDDPLEDWSAPSTGDCDFRVEGWISRTTAQLDPGVYCGGLRVDAKNIFMRPGIYTVRDGPLVLRGESKISGKGVGILLQGSGATLDVDGKSRVELQADTEGPMAGIVIASSASGEVLKSSIAGRADLKIGGVIYLPRHELEYWGESDTRAASPVTTIIGYTVEIGGDAFLEVKNDKTKAKYAPIVSTGNGSVRLVE